jgi:hypothetical protein
LSVRKAAGYDGRNRKKGKEATMNDVKIYKWDEGKGHHVLADAAWLEATYGPVAVDQSQESKAYRVVELWEKLGEASLTVRLEDENGNPLVDIPVVFWFSTAPQLPEWTPPPEKWRTNGEQGRSNQNGDVGFGMGGGAYYFPPNKGPHAVWVGEPGVGTDFVSGLGMLGGTNHNHVEPVFQRLRGEGPLEPLEPLEPPEPSEPSESPEPGTEWATLFAKLDKLIASVEELRSHLSDPH